MNSNNSSIINSRTTNNQQLAPGAPSNQVFNQQQSSQYSNGNNYSNQNTLNNNFNMVAAGQQSGMDVGYNSQVRISLRTCRWRVINCKFSSRWTTWACTRKIPGIIKWTKWAARPTTPPPAIWATCQIWIRQTWMACRWTATWWARWTRCTDRRTPRWLTRAEMARACTEWIKCRWITWIRWTLIRWTVRWPTTTGNSTRTKSIRWHRWPTWAWAIIRCPPIRRWTASIISWIRWRRCREWPTATHRGGCRPTRTHSFTQLKSGRFTESQVIRARRTFPPWVNSPSTRAACPFPCRTNLTAGRGRTRWTPTAETARRWCHNKDRILHPTTTRRRTTTAMRAPPATRTCKDSSKTGGWTISTVPCLAIPPHRWHRLHRRWLPTSAPTPMSNQILCTVSLCNTFLFERDC